VLAALGLAYACLWWSFQRFYGEFGVSPQDVGLAPSGSASDLAGSALQLGVWLMIVLAVLAFLPVAAVIAVDVAVAASSGSERRALVAVAAAVLLLGLTAFLYWWLVDGWPGLVLLAAAAIVFGVLHAIGRLVRMVPADGAGSLAAAMKAVPVTAPGLAITVALACAIVGITFMDLPTDAAEAGRCAATELPPKGVPALNLPFPGLHLPILSVHAQPATLTWLNGSPPATLSLKNVVYLGQANGSVVVYDRTSHTASRIPAGDVAVVIDAAASTCHGVH